MTGIYYALKWLVRLAGEETAASDQMIANQSVDLSDLADKVEPIMDKVAHPSDTFANEDFEEAVTALASNA